MSSKNPRPPREYRTGPVTTALRWACRAGAIALVVGTAVAYPSLPAEVPTHFGPTGQPDNWGSKATILVVVAIAAVIIAALDIASHFPRQMNYPKALTAENAQVLYRAGEQTLVWTSTGVTLLMAGAIASVANPEVSVLVLPLGLVALVVGCGAGIVRMLRA